MPSPASTGQGCEGLPAPRGALAVGIGSGVSNSVLSEATGLRAILRGSRAFCRVSPVEMYSLSQHIATVQKLAARSESAGEGRSDAIDFSGRNLNELGVAVDGHNLSMAFRNGWGCSCARPGKRQSGASVHWRHPSAC